MKKAIPLLIALFFVFNSSFSEENLYPTSLNKLKTESETLKNICASNSIDYAKYDQWFSGFKTLMDEFLKDFSITHKERPSFQLIKAGGNNLSLAWTLLKQAEYADAQYRDFITTGDVGYAHKWKEQSREQRSDALEKINQALSDIDKAVSSLTSE
ncbi:MAG: hypothetical protein PHQ96_07655 [Candidatus Omnitrophica bacterium]|nr:hypothetical protein [Candidatus Omnitrophota bacterium]